MPNTGTVKRHDTVSALESAHSLDSRQTDDLFHMLC